MKIINYNLKKKVFVVKYSNFMIINSSIVPSAFFMNFSCASALTNDEKKDTQICVPIFSMNSQRKL